MKKLFLALMMFAPLAALAQKFGHVNSQAIMESLPEFIKARGEIEAQAKQYEDQMKEMQTEIQTESEAYDKNQSTMNPTAKAEAEAKLNGLYQKYQQALQDNQQAIQNVGKNGGYVYIMDTAGGIPYISQTLSKDVTEEVKAEMNKMK